MTAAYQVETRVSYTPGAEREPLYFAAFRGEADRVRFFDSPETARNAAVSNQWLVATTADGREAICDIDTSFEPHRARVVAVEVGAGQAICDLGALEAIYARKRAAFVESGVIRDRAPVEVSPEVFHAMRSAGVEDRG